MAAGKGMDVTDNGYDSDIDSAIIDNFKREQHALETDGPKP